MLKLLNPGKNKKSRKTEPKIHESFRVDSTISTQTSPYLSENVTSSNVSRSLSYIWELDLNRKGPHDLVNASETKSENPELNSTSPNEQSNFQKDQLVSNSDAEKELSWNSRPPLTTPAQSAAAFYGSISLKDDSSILGTCQSVDRLNQYLKAAKADLKAGVPGKFLNVVIGQEVADVGSVGSTIACAFFLNETQTSSQICVLPVINTKRAEFSMHSDIKWLFKTCRIDESSLVFIDEIDLSYHNQFGNLKVILINGYKLPSKKEGLKDAQVEEFNLKEEVGFHSPFEESSADQDGSCCTLIAEKYAEKSPELLAGQGFCRLLLSGILLDTENLTSSDCTSRDKYMATLLIKGAGHFGCNGLYQLLKCKLSDVSELMVKDILRKDFRKWARASGKPNSTSNIGMCSIGISVEELLEQEESAADEVILFRESEKLRLLMVVSGYYDSQKTFKREVLVSTDTPELMRKFLTFCAANGTNLPLKSMKQSDLKNELRAFEITNLMTSRRSIERLLEEFYASLRKQHSHFHDG